MILALLITLLLIGASVYGYTFLLYKWVYADANEWMLIIRDGTAIHQGLGITAKVGPQDKVVRFPSRIYKVNFSVQQVTKEVQGVEVSGAIVWKVDPEGEGPFKAYKYLGKDISSNEPANANSHLTHVGTAVVRHRVANLTLDELLRNRDLMRTEMLQEITRVAKGWGIALESVEITEVKILSESLFNNMQAPFREEQRFKAEMITMNATNDISSRRKQTELTAFKKEIQNSTSKQIYSLNQNYKSAADKQKSFEEQVQINKKKLDAQYKVKEEQYAADVDLRRKEQLTKHEADKKAIDDQIVIAKKQQELVDAQEEIKRNKLLAKLKRKEEAEQLKRELREKHQKMLNETHAKSDFRYKALETCNQIYSAFPVAQMDAFDFGTKGKDPVLSFVGQLVQGLKKVESIQK